MTPTLVAYLAGDPKWKKMGISARKGRNIDKDMDISGLTNKSGTIK